MNFVSPFESEKEFKVYNNILIFTNFTKYITLIQYDPLDISLTISSFYKGYAEMNSGEYYRLSENWIREKTSDFTLFLDLIPIYMYLFSLVLKRLRSHFLWITLDI